MLKYFQIWEIFFLFGNNFFSNQLCKELESRESVQPFSNSCSLIKRNASYRPMKYKNQKGSKKQNSTADIYNFSGPLWDQYYKETRKKVRFPRGYKDVSIYDWAFRCVFSKATEVPVSLAGWTAGDAFCEHSLRIVIVIARRISSNKKGFPDVGSLF